MSKKPLETDGERARRQWEQIEREGLFYVLQIVGGYELLVRVPWCRFARGVTKDEDLAKLNARYAAWKADQEANAAAELAQQHKLPVVPVGKNEAQLMLFW